MDSAEDYEVPSIPFVGLTQSIVYQGSVDIVHHYPDNFHLQCFAVFGLLAFGFDSCSYLLLLLLLGLLECRELVYKD